jgi:hypothetical protein
MLPCYVADQEKSLEPVLPDVVKATQAYHMVVHADLRDLPRVQTAANYIAKKVTAERALFVPSPNRSNQPKTPSFRARLVHGALTPLAAQGHESVSVLERLQSAVLAETGRLSAVGD